MKKRAFGIIIIVFLSTFITLFRINDVQAKFIDTSFHNSVVVDSPTYISGVKNINVYTNKTIQNYELRLNGTLLNSAAHPRQFINDRWYADYSTLTQGENQAGNLRYCDVADTNYLYCQSQTVAVAWLLGVPVDWDEFINQQFCFGTGGFDTSYINATWLEWRIQLTRQSSVNDKVIQYWRTSDSTWQTLATLTENAWATGNTSCSAIANLGTIDKSFWIRIYCRDTNADDEMQINVDYLRLYYTSTQVISNDRDYSLVDTYAFNSSTKTDGKYNLTARIKDFAGVWWNDMKWVWIDNTKPTIGTINISPGILNNTVPLSITTTISDTFLNNSYGQYTNGYNQIQVPNGASTSFNYTSYFTNRTYNFYIYAIDHAGNVASKNKTFSVSYVKDILYVQNPIINIISDRKQYVNNNAWVNVSCSNVGELKFFVNGTWNSTHSNPVSVNKSFYSSSMRTLQVTMRFTYINSTFFKNVTSTINFINPTFVYIEQPSVFIGASLISNITTNSCVIVIAENLGMMKLHVYSWYNMTTNITTYNDTSSPIIIYLTSYIPDVFNVTIELFHENSTFYNNFSIGLKFDDWTIIKEYIHDPEVSISYQSRGNITQPAFVNASCDHVGQIKFYVNGTWNSTTNGTQAGIELNSSIVQTFNVTISIFYENLTFYKNFTAIVEFYNGNTLIKYEYIPSISIAYNDLQNITIPALIDIDCDHVGKISIYINGTWNSTTDDPSSIELQLNSSIVQTFNVTIEIFYENLTFYKNMSLLVDFFNGTQIVIQEPSFNMVYQTYQNISKLAWLNITCEQIGKINIYVGDILNQTHDAPLSSINFNITTSSPQSFDIIIEMFHENLTFYKNFTANIEFFNWTILNFIHEPKYEILAQLIQNITRTAWINVTCDHVGTLKYYVNGTLNTTISNPTTHNFSLYSPVPCTFQMNLVFYNQTGYMFKNSSFDVDFINGTRIDHYIIEPSINIVYQGTQNITRTAWINATCLKIGRLKFYVNGTWNSTFDDPSNVNFGLNSSIIQSFNMTIEVFHENLTFYKNITFMVSFFNGTTITNQSYIYNPSIVVSYNNETDIGNVARASFDLFHVSQIIIYVNGTWNCTFSNKTSASLNITSNEISTFNIVVESFYDNLTFYKNISFTMEFINMTKLEVYITAPSFSIIYPRTIFLDDIDHVSIATSLSGGFKARLSLNGTFINETFYVGNASHDVNIPSGGLGNVSFAFNILSTGNASYQNVTIVIFIIEEIPEPVNYFFEITINKYDKEIEIDYSSKNTAFTEFYWDAELIKNFTGDANKYFLIKGLSVDTNYQLDILIYNEFGFLDTTITRIIKIPEEEGGGGDDDEGGGIVINPLATIFLENGLLIAAIASMFIFILIIFLTRRKKKGKKRRIIR